MVVREHYASFGHAHIGEVYPGQDRQDKGRLPSRKTSSLADMLLSFLGGIHAGVKIRKDGRSDVPLALKGGQIKNCSLRI